MSQFNLSHIIWGFGFVMVARKMWNALTIEENRKREVLGRPVEMKDVDNTSLKGPVYKAVGPYAVQT